MLGFEFQLACIVYTYITQLSICVLSFNWCKILLSPDLPECNFCVSGGVSVRCSTPSHGDRTDPPIQFIFFTLRQGGHMSDMFIIISIFCSFKHWMTGRVQNFSNSECSVRLSHQVELHSGLGELNIKS